MLFIIDYFVILILNWFCLFWNVFDVCVFNVCVVVEFVGEMMECVDFIDDVGKKLGYMVLKGDFCYKFFVGIL